MQMRSKRRPNLLMQIMETGLLKCNVDLTTVQSYFVLLQTYAYYLFRYVIPIITVLFSNYPHGEAGCGKQVLYIPKTC